MNTFLKLHRDDNVQVALRMAPKGSIIKAEGGPVGTLTEVAMAHKVADRAISEGEMVIKYGMPIGVATVDIAPGAHVHVHNIASRYTATHYREEDAGLTDA
ncbi:UxaA family hydrolase [Oceanomicrobium pacificus]|uniref:Altronate hydrolase n=1 Tax=Oceanomicrobium pacificus TaxID=2692916 RepID=A0A6B0TZS0_9RHOB|nr:UxaA family hydrolase [Oceanomicrobium pacificus]MXU66898.1 altronate hydrolase [Oceanomicrobium pacificus]